MSDNGGLSQHQVPGEQAGHDAMEETPLRQMGSRAETIPVRARRGGGLDEPSARYASHEFVYSQPPSDGDDGPQINILAMLWRRRWVILLCLLLSIGGSVWYLMRAEPVYQSIATVKISPSTPRLVGDGVGGGGSRNYLNTEIMVMQSSQMLEAVIRKPGLLEGPSIKDTDNPGGTVAGMLDITVAGDTDVIFISAEGLDPNDTREVANALLEAYLSENRVDAQSQAKVFKDILEDEIAGSDLELEEIHQRKIEMSRKVGTLDDGSSNIMISQLGSLEAEINRAFTAVLDLEVMLRQIAEAGDDEGLLRALLPLADDRNGDLWGSLRALERERQLISLRLGEKNKQVEMLDARIALLRAELESIDKSVMENAIRAIQVEYDAAKARYETLQQAYDTQLTAAFDANEERAEYQRLLARERRLNAQQDLMLARLQEIDVNTEVSGMNVTPLDFAKTGSQIAPKATQVLGMGLVLGAMLGMGLAFLLEWADPRIRDAEEIQALLDVSVLGAVPALDKRENHGDKALHVANHPNTEASEAFRDIRTVVYFELGISGPGGTRIERADGPKALPGVVGGQMILVTSPLSGDGKTTSACNLAAAVADSGKRTLLLDADCRRPSVARYLRVGSDHGLTNVLGVEEPELPLDKAIQNTSVDNLDVLPCGPVPDRPAEMLNSDRFAEMMETLRQRYDVIIVDSPPVLPVTDARVLSDKADATILVLRAGSSTRRSARHAVDSLLRVNAHLVGVLVNGVPVKKKRFGYGGAGGYGYYYRYSYKSDKNAGRSNGSASNGAAGNGHDKLLSDGS
ncbi:MAG: polysaccharide biosynthesis tyrosine autokinase [Planctomycetota bacterium]